MRHNRFDEEHFSKGEVNVTLDDPFYRVLPFRIQDKAIRNAIDDQHRPRWVAFVALVFEPFEYLAG